MGDRIGRPRPPSFTPAVGAFVQAALDAQQGPLHRQAAAVAAEPAAGAQHAVAGDDDRDRVGAAGGAGGAHRALVAGAAWRPACSCGSGRRGCGRRRAGRGGGSPCSGASRAAGRSRAAGPRSRGRARGGPRRSRPGASSTRGETRLGQVLEQLVGVLAGQAEPDQAARRGGEQQLAEGRVGASCRRRRAGPRRRRGRRGGSVGESVMPAPFSVASFPRAGCAARPPASSRGRRRSRRGGGRRRSAG